MDDSDITCKNNEKRDAANLRQRAEKIAIGKISLLQENVESMPHEEIRRTIHELHVYQIELTMQNEELRRAEDELEAARKRYFDLYDLAPVGYLTMKEQGIIIETNLVAATLLGAARGELDHQPLTRFILKEDQDVYNRYCKKLLETGEPQTCELRMLKKNCPPFWILLKATVSQDAGSAPICRAVISDITGRKQAESQREAALEEIKKLNEDLERKVSERTAELKKTIAQLEELNRSFVGRELKMAQLKERIAELEKKKE